MSAILHNHAAPIIGVTIWALVLGWLLVDWARSKP